MRPRVLVVMVEYSERVDSGARIHDRVLVEELSEISDVTLLVIGPEPPAHIGGSAHELWHPIDNRRRAHRAVDFGRGFFSGRSAVLDRSLRQGGAGALARAARDVVPDVIVLQRPFYGPMIEIGRRFAPVVVEAGESTTKAMRMIALRPASQAARARALMEWLVFQRLEKSLRDADEVWVTSEVESRELQRAVPGVKTHVVPNVIDASAFEDVRRLPLGSTGASYVGTYSYAPNEEAACWIITELAPVFARRKLGVIDLIGRLPTDRMRRLAAAQTGVRVVGEVDEPWRAARASGALVVPLRTGAGTRLKVLEAGASEVPIVSTRFGVEGLDFEPGVHYLRAESAAQFADAVEQLRDDPQRGQALIEAARSAVEVKYSRSAARAAMAASISSLTASAPGWSGLGGSDVGPVGRQPPATSPQREGEVPRDSATRCAKRSAKSLATYGPDELLRNPRQDQPRE